MADWNERYRNGEHSPVEPHQLLVRALPALAPGRALDIACGAGRHAIYLASAGWTVTAVDLSPVGIQVTRERAASRGLMIETVTADLEGGDFTIEAESYDLICVFHYLQRSLFYTLKTGLRSGGTLVAAIHMVDDHAEAKPMNPDFLLDSNELKSTFADWNICYYQEGRGNDPEHKHNEAQLIARKP